MLVVLGDATYTLQWLLAIASILSTTLLFSLDTTIVGRVDDYIAQCYRQQP